MDEFIILESDLFGPKLQYRMRRSQIEIDDVMSFGPGSAVLVPLKGTLDARLVTWRSALAAGLLQRFA